MRRIAITTLAISAVMFVLILVAKITQEGIENEDWWCEPESHFAYWNEKPEMAAFVDLLPKQQELVTEWWQRQVDGMRLASEELQKRLARLEKENPERYSEIRPYRQSMDPVYSNLPNISMLRSMRFACTQKLTFMCRLTGCETRAF